MENQFFTAGDGARKAGQPLWDAGVKAARSMRAVERRRRTTPRHTNKELERAIFAAARFADPEGRSWLIENVRVIRTALEETRELCSSTGTYPHIAWTDGREEPRVRAIAREYLTSAENLFA